MPEVSQGGILDLGSLDSKPDTQLLELKMVEQRSTQQNQKRPASARQSVAQEQVGGFCPLKIFITQFSLDGSDLLV